MAACQMMGDRDLIRPLSVKNMLFPSFFSFCRARDDALGEGQREAGVDLAVFQTPARRRPPEMEQSLDEPPHKSPMLDALPEGMEDTDAEEEPTPQPPRPTNQRA